MKIRFVAAACFLMLSSARANERDYDYLCTSNPILHRSLEEQIQACQSYIHNASGQMGGSSIGSAPDERADGYYHRGLLYHLSGKYELAIADYTSAIGWRRTLEDAYEARGDAYEDLGQHEKASADYVQAATMRIDGSGALAQRCWARAVRGHPLDRALADCNAAIKRGDDDDHVLFSRCLVYFRLGQFADTVTQCQKIVARQPRDASALYLIGVAKLRSGDKVGGDSSIAAALDADYRVADECALYGVKP